MIFPVIVSRNCNLELFSNKKTSAVCEKLNLIGAYGSSISMDVIKVRKPVLILIFAITD